MYSHLTRVAVAQSCTTNVRKTSNIKKNQLCHSDIQIQVFGKDVNGVCTKQMVKPNVGPTKQKTLTSLKAYNEMPETLLERKL